MRTQDFDYRLPPELIAQRPLRPRDSSRLLMLDRASGRISQHIFHDLPSLLSPGDALILNQTRVIPARLPAKKIPTGGRAELLLLRRLSPQEWEARVGGKGLQPGRMLEIRRGPKVKILENLGGSLRRVRFEEPITPRLEQVGQMPLPPYIKEPLRSREEYQTVFAKIPGSAAAPTAGLHFTPRLFRQIAAKGVKTIQITLHIGLDTFLPVRVEDPSRHPIHTEWCRITPRAASQINAVRAGGGRIIAVGTTVARTLETAARKAARPGTVAPIEGPTDLFILPGFQFQAVEAMITNFHLPRSTLLMLVSAFAGKENIFRAYKSAIAAGFRFYSFGDAMLIL